MDESMIEQGSKQASAAMLRADGFLGDISALHFVRLHQRKQCKREEQVKEAPHLMLLAGDARAVKLHSSCLENTKQYALFSRPLAFLRHILIVEHLMSSPARLQRLLIDGRGIPGCRDGCRTAGILCIIPGMSLGSVSIEPPSRATRGVAPRHPRAWPFELQRHIRHSSGRRGRNTIGDCGCVWRSLCSGD